TSEAVADQDLRRHVAVTQEVGCLHEVSDIRGEVGVGEIASAGAQSGKIEAQHGDAMASQTFGDTASGEDVLRAGEAVREQSEGARLVLRQFESARQGRAL